MFNLFKELCLTADIKVVIDFVGVCYVSLYNEISLSMLRVIYVG